MTETKNESSKSESVEAGCFVTLICLSILFVLWSMLSSFGDLSDKDIQRYKENSVWIEPQMEEIEQSLPLLQKRIETMENRFPK
jgi:hypothetical protein